MTCRSVLLTRFVACSKIAGELHAFIDFRLAACLIFIVRRSNRRSEVPHGTKPDAQRSAPTAFRSATAPTAARSASAARAAQQSHSPAGSPAQSTQPTRLADADGVARLVVRNPLTIAWGDFHTPARLLSLEFGQDVFHARRLSLERSATESTELAERRQPISAGSVRSQIPNRNTKGDRR